MISARIDFDRIRTEFEFCQNPAPCAAPWRNEFDRVFLTMFDPLRGHMETPGIVISPGFFVFWFPTDLHSTQFARLCAVRCAVKLTARRARPDPSVRA